MLDLNDEIVNPYDAISALWGIPRHRVKALIYAGGYGIGGSRKTWAAWKDTLKEWDGSHEMSVLPPPSKKGRFATAAAAILKLKGKLR